MSRLSASVSDKKSLPVRIDYAITGLPDIIVAGQVGFFQIRLVLDPLTMLNLGPIVAGIWWWSSGSPDRTVTWNLIFSRQRRRI